MNQPQALPDQQFSAEEKTILKDLARDAIIFSLQYNRMMPLKLEDYPHRLTQPGASFVTLKKAGQLRGCIGSLQAQRPLAEDIVHNAYAAAFLDHRFPPLSVTELAEIEIHISILSPPEPLEFDSEDDLLDKIRPAIDGLILEDEAHKATFLPSVWESLTEPADFLRQLKQKAGLAADYWSASVKVFRYTTESF